MPAFLHSDWLHFTVGNGGPTLASYIQRLTGALPCANRWLTARYSSHLGNSVFWPVTSQIFINAPNGGILSLLFDPLRHTQEYALRDALPLCGVAPSVILAIESYQVQDKSCLQPPDDPAVDWFLNASEHNHHSESLSTRRRPNENESKSPNNRM